MKRFHIYQLQKVPKWWRWNLSLKNETTKLCHALLHPYRSFSKILPTLQSADPPGTGGGDRVKWGRGSIGLGARMPGATGPPSSLGVARNATAGRLPDTAAGHGGEEPLKPAQRKGFQLRIA
ncbi:hypothetical protein AVEN_220608-1 [Araneus ventricosus]|uniref:Uncharacterized protein n=1 Tax=Araneus ventricosus TaxID=182803 RepID=A0A4Y2GLJ2_ARAVE|nr:hypothetical protein AVEN_220608-1 [Araneus ventricosus]